MAERKTFGAKWPVMTLEEIVSVYIETRREPLRKEFRFFEIQKKPSDAIYNAAMCRLPGGKRHQHQRRIKRVALEEAERRLQSMGNKLSSVRDFQALHKAIEGEIGPINGVGELVIYDVARRIGTFFGITPDLVYLHRGTRVGAAALGFKGAVVDPQALPTPFRALTSAEIEDCFCAYKVELRAWARKGGGW